MPLFGRRNEAPLSLEGERERLHAIRIAAEQELTRLRRELVERVATVEKRERELADALARLRGTRAGAATPAPPVADEALAHAEVGLAARAQELARREAALEERERRLVREEAKLARQGQAAPEQRLADIEARLAALQEAEKAFARTRAELAARSDELALREAALAEKERALGGGAAGAGPGVPSRADLDELEERLRRLEQETRDATAERSFGAGLRTLERKGLRGSPPNS
ncbi:MAG TPA: hypothetical protein VNJ53_10735 [Gaiellaceae bacterium]|nr:hypothetical protein [Gaiellaceae bacterium]